MLKHGNLSFTKLPSPKVLDNLRNAYAFHKSVSQLPGVRQLVCAFSVASWYFKHGSNGANANPSVKLYLLRLLMPQVTENSSQTVLHSKGDLSASVTGSPSTGRVSGLMNQNQVHISCSVFLCLQGVSFVLCLTLLHARSPWPPWPWKSASNNNMFPHSF